MHKPIDEFIDPESRQGKHMSAALAIAKLSEHGLPDIHEWRIKDGRAVGQLSGPRENAQRNLGEWAAMLRDAIPYAEHYQHNGFTRVWISGGYGDVPVEIWTGMDRDRVPADWWVRSPVVAA